jgi:DNA polymerase-1
MARETGLVGFDTETTSLDAMQAELVGISRWRSPTMPEPAGINIRAAYVPLTHKTGVGDLLGGGMAENQIPMRDALPRLKALLEDASVLVVGAEPEIRLPLDEAPRRRDKNFDDTMLISYVLDAGTGAHGMDPLSERFLGHKPIAYKDVAGSGKSNGDLRQGRHRQGDALRGRGCRRDAAALAWC